MLFPLPAGSPKIGTITYTDPEEAGIFGGQTYINIHSANFPGGEIRGQIDGPTSACAPTSVTLGGLEAPASSGSFPLGWLAVGLILGGLGYWLRRHRRALTQR